MYRFEFSNKDFDTEHTFDCGQCFRWEKTESGYEGVAGGHWGRFSVADGATVLETDCADDAFWREYLDMDRDYGKIKSMLAVNEYMKKAVEYGSGIRILKQDFFETLMSFIISQRSSIGKIKSTVKKLCEGYGEKIFDEKGKCYYTFPSAEKLANVGADEYRKMGVGYRAEYLEQCVRAVCAGEISEKMLEGMTTQDARRALLGLKGVGDKVCDCVLLFALKKYDLFPSDVWIKRVMCENFGSSADSAKSDGEKMFGELSGFAQQYLFYYGRGIGKVQTNKEAKS